MPGFFNSGCSGSGIHGGALSGWYGQCFAYTTEAPVSTLAAPCVNCQNPAMARNPETDIKNGILLEVGGRPYALAWAQQVGTFRAYDNPQRVIKVGVPGMSDVMSVVALTITPEMVGKTVGVAVAIEAKTLKGKQRDQQLLWQHALQKVGGIYLLARSPEQAALQVDSLAERICLR